jgi:hypothetical protein
MRIAPVALAAAIMFGGSALAFAGIHPSCPAGSYPNGSGPTMPTETGPMPNLTPCTSYETHVAPSSGVTIPVYATGMDAHLAQRWWVFTVGILAGAGAGMWWLVRDRRRSATVAV